MPKEKVSKDRFLELLNQLLAEQEGYTSEMRFVSAPAGSKGTAMTDYDTTTPYTSNGLYAAAVKIAYELYEF